MVDVNCDKEWQNRPPAKFTLDKLKEQEKLNRELEGKDNQFDKTISLMQKDVKDINDKLDCLDAKFDKFIASADTRYAHQDTSWAEGVLKIIGYIVLTVLVSAFMYLIIKDGLIK